MPNTQGLFSVNSDDLPTLTSVQINGRLEGLMLSVTTEQHFHNTTQDTLEVVYTFPLPHSAVLLGAAVWIGDKRLQAVVLEKTQAEADYEEAIDNGDTPVMIERAGPGLFTANLGNLLPGEKAVIEIDWAQSLSIDHGNVRLAIPTVIGERYGDAEFQGELSPHQAPETSGNVRYECGLHLEVWGNLAEGQVSCPSHAITIDKVADDGGRTGKVIRFVNDAQLDRDIVLLVSDLSQTHAAVLQSESGKTTVMASFTPRLAKAARQDLALKVLLDCSGSMEGDSMQSAHKALNHLVDLLTPDDRFSFSKFGSTVIHTRQGGRSLQETTVGEFLIPNETNKPAIQRGISQTDASLGGTELESALLSTLHQIKTDQLDPAKALQPSILLITDGDVWNHAAVVRAARLSGHRVFAIGVGSAPAESLLQNMVHDTGGTAIFVSPNEDMGDAVMRLVDKMRYAQKVDICVSWGDQSPIWETDLPTTVFDQETVHVFAQFAQAPRQAPTIQIKTGTETFAAFAPLTEANLNTDLLARMGMATRMQVLPADQALQAALDYQLVSEQTNLLLVHTRAEDEKAKGLPKLEKIRQMAAAGHSGYGSASNAPDVHYCMSSVAYSKVMPAFLAAPANPHQEPALYGPDSLVSYVNTFAMDYQDFNDLFTKLDDAWWDAESAALLRTIEEVVLHGEYSVAVLLLWLTDDNSPGKIGDLDRHAKRLLRKVIQQIPEQIIEQAFSELMKMGQTA